MKLPLTDAEFKDIYAKVPRLNVEVIIKTAGGIVLAKRDIAPWKGYWHIPGGTVYMGETPEDAAKRVVLDEAGVVVAIDQLLGTIVYPTIREQNGLGWPVGVAYLAHVLSGDLRGSDRGKDIAEFTSLPKSIVPEHAVFLRQHNLIR